MVQIEQIEDGSEPSGNLHHLRNLWTKRGKESGMKGWIGLALWAAVAAGAAIPRTESLERLEAFSLVPLAGIEAKAAAVRVDNQPAVCLSVKKTGAERRMLALEAKSPGDLAWAQAIELHYRLDGLDPKAVQLATVVYERDGGVWYKLAAAGAGPQTARLSLARLREAAFSQDADQKVDLSAVERVWVGAVIDGPATGTLTLTGANVTSAPYHPAAPLIVDLVKQTDWSVAKEDSVTAKVAVVNEGPAGEPVMRFDYTFPATRHMWAIPSIPIRAADLEGYTALRIRYKTNLLKGPNLLFALAERDGGIYVIDPPPAGSTEWTEVVVPLDKLKAASWAKDANNRLDLEPGMSVQVGNHGAANPPGNGTIWIREIALIP